MSKFIRLPDAEFDVMQIIWSQPTPISSVQVCTLASPEKHWKPQTVLTLLTRLTKRGFLNSEKQGGERTYTVLISQEDYLSRGTWNFVQKFHKDTLIGFMDALYADKVPDEEELAALEQWLAEKKRDDRHDES